MNIARRVPGLMVLLPLLVAGCATAPAEPGPVQPIPTALHLTISGATEPVLNADGSGQIGLVREGAAEPIAVQFQNGGVTTTDLGPGRYSIATLGPLTCRGLTFDIEPRSSARALGSLKAEIITTEYYVALMSRKPATSTEIAELAGRTNAAPDRIDATPVSQTEAAPCFMGRGGPGTTWHELSTGEQILLGIGFAGFCAVSLASGGFCAF